MMKTSSDMKHIVRVPLVALFFFTGAVAAQAATYYVALTGNDANSCVTSQTITTPKRTFASAVACVAPGDTLYIRAGTWTEQLNLGSVAGAAGAYKTFAGYPGERPCLTAKNGQGGFAVFTYGPIVSYIILQNLKMDGTCDGTALTSLGVGDYWSISSQGAAPHHITIRDVEVANWSGNGLFISGSAHDLLIQNSSFHDMYTPRPAPPDTCTNGFRYYGFYIHDGSNITIENTEIYNNPGGGMQIYPGPGTNITVRSSKIHDNQSCIPGSGFGGIIIQGTQTNHQIYNNLIYKNGSDPRSGNGTGIAINNVTVTGAKIWNNTIYGNGLGGITGNGITLDDANGGSGPTNTVMQNNIVYGNAAAAQILNVRSSGTTSDHNLITDPLFTNAAILDFLPKAGSPAIDRGVTLSEVTTDYNNNRRPFGFTYDIGAYETGTTSPDPPPASPQGLTVR